MVVSQYRWLSIENVVDVFFPLADDLSGPNLVYCLGRGQLCVPVSQELGGAGKFCNHRMLSLGGGGAYLIVAS